MFPTSGTYNFQSIQVELIIREAYERIGILGDFVEPVKLQSARRSINLLLLDWLSKSVNLWTLRDAEIPLIQGQAQYTLPATVSDIVQANFRSPNSGGIPTRVLDGTAASTAGGVAQNAFDGDPATSCIQTAPDGAISYDFGLNITREVITVGIQSNITANYALLISTSADGANWNDALQIIDQPFAAGVNLVFDIPVPVSARFYRVLGTNGVSTLNIQEIYLNANIATLDYTITAVSRYEYNTYPNKQTQGRPSIYYLDRQVSAPIINIWPTPSEGSAKSTIFYSYKKVMEDVGLYTNAIEIPSSFFSALIWGLSWHLAVKFNPQAAQMLKGEYEQSFAMATEEDSENTPVTIMADNSSYRQ